jgi:hypothetical protein
MNRRDLFGGAAKTAVAGLIAGTVLSADQPEQDPRTSWGPQPMYHVLYVFQRHPVDDFVAVGIYTKQDDAIEHMKKIAESRGVAFELERTENQAHSRTMTAVCAVARSHEELCYELANCRLGAMADCMKQFMALPARGGYIEEEHATYKALYGKSEFPVAIATKG